MQYPEFLDADTLTTRLESAYGGAISTATVQSKQYLYGLFKGEYPGPGDPLPQREADFHWDPRTCACFIPNPSYHAQDTGTMEAFLAWIRENRPDPQFAFVNLGDVDRSGHADESGVSGGVSAFRQAALTDTDTQIGLLVDELQSSGAWDESVLIFTSDHGFDWGSQNQFPATTDSLSAAGFEEGTGAGGQRADFGTVGGGGSELYYVRNEYDIAPMARVLNEVEGVDFVATKEPIPGLGNPTLAEMGIDHWRSPDIHVFLEPGWHSSPLCGGCTPNPLPGNHGHSVTQHSTLFVTGGHPLLDSQPESVNGEPVYNPATKLFSPPSGGPGNLSIAPTVAALFGIGEPAGGYDGPPLVEAFDAGALEGRPAPSPGGGGDAPPDAEPDAGPNEPLLTVGVDNTSATLTEATYKLFVANRGDATADDVVITNPVPQKTTFSGSDNAPLGGSPACEPGALSGTPCQWAVGDLPPGASVTVEATYALEQSETAYSTSYAFASTVSAQAANGGGTPSNTDSSLVRYAPVLTVDTHVDDGRPGTVFGSCNTLSVRGDNAVTAFLDSDEVVPSFNEFYGGPDGRQVESLWAAELRASVSSASASPLATIGAHKIAFRRWTEGTGNCGGVLGSGRDARAPSATEPDTEPVSDPFALGSAAVAGPGPVSWDVSAAFDTRAERRQFQGFELRAGLGLSALDAFTFHSSEASASASWPRLVVLYTKRDGARCIDSDPNTATGPSHRAQRIDAHVTDGSLFSNSGQDGCNGYPEAGAGVGWEIDDDTPDAYISSLDGAAVREVGSSGDAGPNVASTRTDAEGQTFIKIALGGPLWEPTGESRVGALLPGTHDGYNDPGTTSNPNNGVCEPGQESDLQIALGQTCPGEGANSEVDARRTWNSVPDFSVTQTDSPDPVSVGEMLTYTINVTNRGHASANNVKLTDLLPKGVRLRSARADRGRCARRTLRRIECDLLGLADGGTATVTIVVRPTRPGALVNTATVDVSQPPDLATADNIAIATTTVVR